MAKTQLEEARYVLELLSQGKHPIERSNLEHSHFLHDPRVIRPLCFLLGHLHPPRKMKKPSQFFIPPGIVDQMKFPELPLGTNEFCKQLNGLLNLEESKPIKTHHFYKKLKELGILSEEVQADGKRRTITNETSEGYGITMINREFRGRPYQQIVFDETGIELLKKLTYEMT